MGLASTAVLVSVVLVSASFTSGTFTSVKEFHWSGLLPSCLRYLPLQGPSWPLAQLALAVLLFSRGCNAALVLGD